MKFIARARSEFRPELRSVAQGHGQLIAGIDTAPCDEHSGDATRYRLDELSQEILQSVLGEIYTSPAFAKSRRSRELLAYLAEKSQAGQQRELTEYAIGIECFRRDPRSYSTGEDPIVRVQVGRLRERLKQYYANSHCAVTYRLIIPVGGYVPHLEASEAQLMPDREQPLALCFVPLQCIGDEREYITFTQGLNEELGDQLFRCLQQPVCMMLNGTARAALETTQMYYLEGSVRYEADSLKIALRLIHGGLSQVLWAQQSKHCAPQLNLCLQETIAAELAQILQAYFAR